MGGRLKRNHFPRGGFHLAQRGADVNRLAVVAVEIFAKLLLAENFTQSRKNTRKFYTPTG